jgi:hypothetical protein
VARARAAANRAPGAPPVQFDSMRRRRAAARADPLGTAVAVQASRRWTMEALFRRHLWVVDLIGIGSVGRWWGMPRAVDHQRVPTAASTPARGRATPRLAGDRFDRHEVRRRHRRAQRLLLDVRRERTAPRADAAAVQAARIMFAAAAVGRALVDRSRS